MAVRLDSTSPVYPSFSSEMTKLHTPPPSEPLGTAIPDSLSKVSTFIRENWDNLKIKHDQLDKYLDQFQTAHFQYFDELLECLMDQMILATEPKIDNVKLKPIQQLMRAVDQRHSLHIDDIARCCLLASISGKPLISQAMQEVLKQQITKHAEFFVQKMNLQYLTEGQLLGISYSDFLHDNAPSVKLSPIELKEYEDIKVEFKRQLRIILAPASLAHHCTKFFLAKANLLHTSANDESNRQQLTKTLFELPEMTVDLSMDSVGENKCRHYQVLHTALCHSFNLLTCQSSELAIESPLCGSTIPEVKSPFKHHGPFSIVVSQPLQDCVSCCDAKDTVSKMELVNLPAELAYPILLDYCHAATDFEIWNQCCKQLLKGGIYPGVTNIIDMVTLAPLQHQFDELLADESVISELHSTLQQATLTQLGKLDSYVYCPQIKARLLEIRLNLRGSRHLVNVDVAALPFLSQELQVQLLQQTNVEQILINAVNRFGVNGSKSEIFVVLANTGIDPTQVVFDAEDKTSVMERMIRRCHTDTVKPFINSKERCSSLISPLSEDLQSRIPVLLYASVFKSDLVKYMIKELGASVFIKGLRGTNIMHYAAVSDNEILLKYLHKECALPVDSVDEFKRTPLHIAATQGNEVTTRYLVKQMPALVKMKTTDKSTALMFAQGKLEKAKSDQEQEKYKVCCDLLKTSTPSAMKNSKSSACSPEESSLTVKADEEETDWLVVSVD